MSTRGLLLSLACTFGSAANLISNPSFETQSRGEPTAWATYGGAVTASSNSEPHTGAAGVSITSTTSSGILYQRYLGGVEVGALYMVSAWARAEQPSEGIVSIEYLDADGGVKLASNVTSFSPSTGWVQYTASLAAPAGAVQISAVIGTAAGSTLLFDDVSLDALRTPAYSFDLAEALPAALEGFGVNVWASMAAGLEGLEPLNIRWVRTTQDGDSLAQLRALRTRTRALGIQQIYLLWEAPPAFTAGGMLRDIPGFAAYWAALVARLAGEGVCPDHIDLMNEPDSGGAWSTGISPANYSALVLATRAALDSAGLANVSIFGPGTVVLGNAPAWISALEPRAVASLGRFVSHAYDDGPGMPGYASLSQGMARFAGAASAAAGNASASLFVTEYATHNPTYNGVTYPNGDETPAGQFSMSDTAAYAVRVAENTLALLNGGAASAWYWCAQDAGGKTWGWVDATGRAKPVYAVLANLYPKLPVGGSMLRPPPAMQNDISLGALRLGARLVLAATNSGQIEQSARLRLSSCPSAGLRLLNATAVRVTAWGNPAQGQWDSVESVDAQAQVTGDLATCSLSITLPAVSTLTVEMELLAR